MLAITKDVVAQRQRCGHSWLLFVEVPISDDEGAVYVDVLLALETKTLRCEVAECMQSACMLGIEHQGTSHSHAWPVKGNRKWGQKKQQFLDERKRMALAFHGIPLLCFDIDKQGYGLSRTCEEHWRATLSKAMIACEQSTAVEVSVM